MNKMKKIWFKSAFLAMVGMSMTSCGDFLDIYPLTMVYEDNYWNEKNDVDQIVTGCYTRMQDDDFVRRLFIWGESRSDNTRKGFHPKFSATSAEGYILSGIFFPPMLIPIGRVSILSSTVATWSSRKHRKWQRKTRIICRVTCRLR